MKYLLLTSSLCLCLSALFFSENIKAQITNIISEDGDGILGISALMNATINNDVEAVKFFSKINPSSVNQKNVGGATALHIASRSDNNEIAKILIENGANVNAADNEGWTPLMRAVTAKNSELVDILLTSGADAGKKNNIGETAIINATTSGCGDCLKIMFSKYNFPENVDLITLRMQLEKASVIALNKNDISTQSILKDYINNNIIHNANTATNNSLITIQSLDDKTPFAINSNKKRFKFTPNNTPISTTDKSEKVVKIFKIQEVQKSNISGKKYIFKSNKDAIVTKQDRQSPVSTNTIDNTKNIKATNTNQPKKFIFSGTKKDYSQDSATSKKIETQQQGREDISDIQPDNATATPQTSSVDTTTKPSDTKPAKSKKFIFKKVQ